MFLEAFVPAGWPSAARPRVSLAARVGPTGRPRAAPIASASRSLDSYREGPRRSGMRHEREYDQVSLDNVTGPGRGGRGGSGGSGQARGGSVSRRDDAPHRSAGTQTRTRLSRGAVAPSRRDVLKYNDDDDDDQEEKEDDDVDDDDDDDDGTVQDTQQQQRPKAPRTRIGLLRALARANVASNETCAVLLRGGFVRVNGLVRQEPSFLVDTLHDVVSVNDRDVEFPPPLPPFSSKDDDGDLKAVRRRRLPGRKNVDKSSSSGRSSFDDDDESILTRVQRDFRKGKFAEDGRAPRDKKYTRQIDGGFYSGRRWSSGK